MSLSNTDHNSSIQNSNIPHVSKSLIYSATNPYSNFESHAECKEIIWDKVDSKLEQKVRRIYKPKFHKVALYQEENERQRESNIFLPKSPSIFSLNTIETPEREKDHLNNNNENFHHISPKDCNTSFVNLTKISDKSEELFAENIKEYNTSQLFRIHTEEHDFENHRELHSVSPHSSSLSLTASLSGIETHLSEKKKYGKNNISSPENLLLSSSVNENMYDDTKRPQLSCLTIQHQSPELKLDHALSMPNEIESEMLRESATMSLVTFYESYNQPLNLSLKRKTEDYELQKNILIDEANALHESAPSAYVVSARKVKRSSTEIRAHQQLCNAELYNTVEHSKNMDNMISKFTKKRIREMYSYDQYSHISPVPYRQYERLFLDESNIHLAEWANAKPYSQIKSVMHTPTRQYPLLTTPSYPSPGPLLGSTPLVNNYKESTEREKGDDVSYSVWEGSCTNKRRKHIDFSPDMLTREANAPHPSERDASTKYSSEHSIPEATLSEYPTRPNSTRIVDGQEKVFDSGKIMVPGTPYNFNHFVSTEMPTYRKMVKNYYTQVNPTEMYSEIVNIAKSGFHSDSTLVQKSPTKTSQDFQSASSKDKENINALDIPNTVLNSSSSASKKLNKSESVPKSSGSALHTHKTSLSVDLSDSPLSPQYFITNKNSAVNTHFHPSKLLVPVMPNIPSPILSESGTPVSYTRSQLPFASLLPGLANVTLSAVCNTASIQPHPLFSGNPQFLKSLIVVSKPSISKDIQSPTLYTSSSKYEHGMLIPISYTDSLQTTQESEQVPYVPGVSGPIPQQISPTKSVLKQSPCDTLSTETFQVPLDLFSNNNISEKDTRNGDVRYMGMQPGKNMVTTLHIHSTSEESLANTAISVTSAVDKSNEIMHMPKTLIPLSVKLHDKEDSDKSNKHFGINGKKHSNRGHTSYLPPSLHTNDTVEATEIRNTIKIDGTETVSEKIGITPISNRKETAEKESGKCEKTLRRPTSLPLTSQSFTPKKCRALDFHHVPALSLVSPETPRQNKTYAELYLNGQAYTYLILKCSTKSFFCTLNKLQPMYVLHTPENAKLSMYSNWKIFSHQDTKNNFLQLDPSQIISLYDSRHRPSSYTVAKQSHGQEITFCTHSSYFVKNQESTEKSVVKDNSASLLGVDSILHEDNGLQTVSEKYVVNTEEKEESFYYGNGDISKKKREHEEAAYSLLSLSAVSGKASPSQNYLAAAGLIPVLSTCSRPVTYPYSAIPVMQHISGSTLKTGAVPKTPTLVLKSPEKEKEKISRNAGLASLEYSNPKLSGMFTNDEGSDKKLSSMVCRRGNAPSLTIIQPKKTLSDRNSSLNVSPVIFTLKESTVHSAVGKRNFENIENNNSVGVQEKRNKYMCVEKNANASKSQEYSRFDSTDLSNWDREKMNEGIALCESNSINASVSDIVSLTDPARTIASLCNSAEHYPVSSNGGIFEQPLSTAAESNVVKTYITKQAVKEYQMNQYQNFENYILDGSDTRMTKNKTEVLSSQPSSIQAINPQIQKQGKTDNMSSESTKTSYAKPEIEYTDSNRSDTLPETTFIKTARVLVSENESVDSFISRQSPLNLHVANTCKQEKPTYDKINKGFNGKNLRTLLSKKSGSSGKPKAQFMPPKCGPVPNYIGVNADGKEYCTICNKVFSKATQMRMHIAIHYLERPYRCKSCAVSFRSEGHLSKHERSVSHQNKISMDSTFGAAGKSNPRPFQCNDCMVAFRIHGHLAKHLRSKLHILRLECLCKIPFGTYAAIESEGFNISDIDTTDCQNALESLQMLAAQRMYEKDPSKLSQWEFEKGLDENYCLTVNSDDTSSNDGECIPSSGQKGEHHQENHSTVTDSQKESYEYFNTTSYAQNVDSDKTDTVNINSNTAQDLALKDVYYSEVTEVPNFVQMNIPQSVPTNRKRETILMTVRDYTKKCQSDTYVKNCDDKLEDNFRKGKMIEQNNYCDAASVPMSTTFAPHLDRIKHTSKDCIIKGGEVCESQPSVGPSSTNCSAATHKDVSQSEDKLSNTTTPKLYVPSTECEDTSKNDLDHAMKISYTCPICFKVSLDFGGLKIHSFVEHGLSIITTDSQQSMAQDKISMSTLKTSLVPPIKNFPLPLSMVPTINSIAASTTQNINHNVCPTNSESSCAHKAPGFTGTPKKRFKFAHNTDNAPKDFSFHPNKNCLKKNIDVISSTDTASVASAVVSKNILPGHHTDTTEEGINTKECKTSKNSGKSSHNTSSQKHSGGEKGVVVIPVSYSVNPTIESHTKHGTSSSHPVGENEDHSRSDIICWKKKYIHSEMHEAVNESSGAKNSLNTFKRSNESDSHDEKIMLSCSVCGLELFTEESLQQHLLTHSQ